MLAVVIRDRRTTEVRRARVFIPRLAFFRVLLLRVGFSGMFRPSEIMNLTFEDLVTAEDHGHVVLEEALVLLTRSTPQPHGAALAE